jgi:hypothetical protein
MTHLEVEAQNIVNDVDSDFEVTDDARYQALLDKRKNRRTVSSTLLNADLFDRVNHYILS